MFSLKNIVRDWIGVDCEKKDNDLELRREIRDICKDMIITAFQQDRGLQLLGVNLDGLVHHFIDDMAKEYLTNNTKLAIKKAIDNEDFIDSVIERINKKQLK